MDGADSEVLLPVAQAGELVRSRRDAEDGRRRRLLTRQCSSCEESGRGDVVLLVGRVDERLQDTKGSRRSAEVGSHKRSPGFLAMGGGVCVKGTPRPRSEFCYGVTLFNKATPGCG